MDPNWLGRLKAAGRACRWYRQACAESTAWMKQFEVSFTGQGGVLPSQQTLAAQKWTCDQCDKWFVSKRALASHSARAHGYRNIVKFFAVGDTCQHCCRWYHNRSRLVEHLRDATSCMEVLRACFPPISDEKLAQYDALILEATAALKKEGWGATKALNPMRKVYGPALPPADSDARDSCTTSTSADKIQQDKHLLSFKDDVKLPWTMAPACTCLRRTSRRLCLTPLS